VGLLYFPEIATKVLELSIFLKSRQKCGINQQDFLRGIQNFLWIFTRSAGKRTACIQHSLSSSFATLSHVRNAIIQSLSFNICYDLAKRRENNVVHISCNDSCPRLIYLWWCGMGKYSDMLEQATNLMHQLDKGRYVFFPSYVNAHNVD
jgi:hypothetical protein